MKNPERTIINTTDAPMLFNCKSVAGVVTMIQLLPGSNAVRPDIVKALWKEFKFKKAVDDDKLQSEQPAQDDAQTKNDNGSDDKLQSEQPAQKDAQTKNDNGNGATDGSDDNSDSASDSDNVSKQVDETASKVTNTVSKTTAKKKK